MGAYEFYNIAKGKTPEEAFISKRDEVAWEEGHGGYTGSLAEKHDFELIEVPEGRAREVIDLAQGRGYGPSVPKELAPYVEKASKFYEDKWGPAGMVEVKGAERNPDLPDDIRVFILFGIASS